MNNPVIRFLYVVAYLAVFSILTILGAIVTVGAGLFSERAARYITNAPWAYVTVLLAGIRLKATGLENLPPEKGGFIIYVNHTSLLDIPTVSLTTGRSVTWVAKASLAKIPFFGWALVQGHMLVDRGGGPSAARAMVEEASRRLADNQTLAIFPEGTRNRGDVPLLPFKKGTFILAKHTGAKLVPVAVKNAGRLWPAGKYWPRPGVIRVKIGQPFAPGESESLASLTARAQTALNDLLVDESW